jgi:hypothetical protein
MKFNMNNYVEVVLTGYGAKIYNSWASSRVYSRPLMEKGNVLKDQLWMIMYVFGEHISLGMNSPFEYCEIDLLNFGE